MKFTGLTDLISHLDPVRNLTQNRRTSVYGLMNGAKPVVAASLARLTGRQMLIVTAHPQSAHDLSLELASWADGAVALFPALESLPYERVQLDRELLAQREAVARDIRSGALSIAVAPIRALMQPVTVPDEEQGSNMELAVGRWLDLDATLADWLDAGYAEVSMVDEVGTFARRGGVVDIFPAGAQYPVRAELFGHEIDSLRTFDPESQRSIASIDRVSISPLARVDDDARLRALVELMDIDTTALNAAARTRWLDDLARLEAGAGLDDVSIFAPYFLERQESLVDILPSSALVLIDDAAETWLLLDDLWGQAVAVQQGLVEAGDLPAGLKSALIEPATLKDCIASLHTVELFSGSPPDGDQHDLSALFTPPHLYAGRLRSFVQEIEAQPRRSTVIASQQHERVRELLLDQDIAIRQVERLQTNPEPGVTLLPGPLAEGWALPQADLLVLSDHELFGHARSHPVPRRRRAARESFFADFQPGDYVVHLEHGIGRFEGVTRMSIDGAEREYALVQYAGTDRVYVPTDQLERLTRYVGMGDTAPQLNKLGGGEWQRARQRAKQAAEDIARELIDLYSKRMARPGYAFGEDTPWQHEVEASFPYPETPDQLQAVADVKADMEESRPMDRLVCADVGYGKTEVAVRAAFKAVMDGRQVAVLVPTTILAQQHFETFSDRFAAFPLRVEALSRFRSPAEQRQILQRVAAGEVDVLIGTHRILQKDVQFKNLGLLIIDEEQRFGVKHKEQLKKLRETIDVLTLTATPIPRTLHMGLVGIREISVIETPPEGRLPIRTFLQPYDDRLVREAVLRELDRDGQVYIVHNKVATIDAMAEKLRRLVPEARVVVGHGQMDEAQLEKVMLSFAHHEADVLLCSTIIENGLDIPNVNTIIVNNAHRLGLTQLYQLRGRVGRSANQAYAYLLYPRDVRLSHDAMRRMEAVFEAQELGAGFTIAMKDLEIRGAGNLLGAQQSGHATAIGFDLYTRMISDAVEQLRGVPRQEPLLVTLDLPLTMYLPPDYLRDETERLSLYRRLASVGDADELKSLADEMRDRFGPLPLVVKNLITSVGIKLLAREAQVTSITLNGEYLVMRTGPLGLYDRVSLYRKFGVDAKISTNVLRIPRRLLGKEWLDDLRAILQDMINLRQSVGTSERVGA
jgi:transcription-repair coupling factor (superfamily II helicase)